MEGEEEGVLKGLTRTLYKCRPVLYLENQCASKSKTLLAELTHQGYICWYSGTLFLYFLSFFVVQIVRAIICFCLRGWESSSLPPPPPPTAIVISSLLLRLV